jgi:hypothetical protein
MLGGGIEALGQNWYVRAWEEWGVVRIGSPAPSPSSKCCPPPLWFQGGGTLACGSGGGGEPIRTKGQTLWYSRNSLIPLRFSPMEVC